MLLCCPSNPFVHRRELANMEGQNKNSRNVALVFFGVAVVVLGVWWFIHLKGA